MFDLEGCVFEDLDYFDDDLFDRLAVPTLCFGLYGWAMISLIKLALVPPDLVNLLVTKPLLAHGGES